MKEELEIQKVEFTCTNCGKWEENETGLTFYHALLCKKCREDNKNKDIVAIIKN